MKTFFMALPVIALSGLLLFGQDISDWVRLKRVQYSSYEKATRAKPDNFILVHGTVYNKHGVKQ